MILTCLGASVSLYMHPLIVARQRLCKQVPSVTNTQATVKNYRTPLFCTAYKESTTLLLSRYSYHFYDAFDDASSNSDRAA
jgi:hypothetical protein